MAIIDKKAFTKVALNKNIKIFIMYMIFLSFKLMLISSTSKIEIVFLITKKIKILIQYLDFLDVFLKEKALVLLVISDLNKHIIKL